MHGPPAKGRVAELCTSSHPCSVWSISGYARRSSRSCNQSSTSLSTHPTLLGPSCIRSGNFPAFSRRAICCGEYKTNSLSWRFDSILITMSPKCRNIAMPQRLIKPQGREMLAKIESDIQLLLILYLVAVTKGSPSHCRTWRIRRKLRDLCD